MIMCNGHILMVIICNKISIDFNFEKIVLKWRFSKNHFLYSTIIIKIKINAINV